MFDLIVCTLLIVRAAVNIYQGMLMRSALRRLDHELHRSLIGPRGDR